MWQTCGWPQQISRWLQSPRSVSTIRSRASFQGFYVPWQPAVVPAPRLLFLNHSLAAELGLDVASLEGAARRGDIRRKHAASPAPNRWLRPTRATSSADSHRNSATAARCFSAR